MAHRSPDATCSRIRSRWWGAADESDCKELCIWGRSAAAFPIHEHNTNISVSWVRDTITCTTACTIASGRQYWF